MDTINFSPIDTSFLIEPDALHSLRKMPLLVDTQVPERYAESHLPGAINLCTYDRFVRSTSPIGLSRFQREIAGYYSEVGLTRSQPVVVYENRTGMRAARECWMLQYLGHTDVRILHGGMWTWRLSGGAVTTETPNVYPETFSVEACPDIVVGVDGIISQIGLHGNILIDVRTHEEFLGMDRSKCCRLRGRIPGAFRIEWTGFIDEDTGRFKPPDAIHRILRDHDIDPEAEIVTYCHRGARSAVVYYALRYAGCRRVRNFIGSWHEWAARYDLPVETGE